MTREERAEAFRQWKLDLIAREPSELPETLTIPVLRTMKSQLIGRAISEWQKTVMDILDMRICRHCGLDMGNYQECDIVEHYAAHLDAAKERRRGDHE